MGTCACCKCCEPVAEKVAQLQPEHELAPDGVAGVCGLRNLGNTCYMNGALQCLGATPVLGDYFAGSTLPGEDRSLTGLINERNPHASGAAGHKGEVAREFRSLMQAMWGGRFRWVNPWRFRGAMVRAAPQFAGFRQQDSQELLSCVLDALHEDLNAGGGAAPPKGDPLGDGAAQAEQAAHAWQQHRCRNDSPIDSAFCFQLRSQVVCRECGYASPTFDPARMLVCPIPGKGDGPVDIAACIRAHNKSEDICDGAAVWRCPKCKEPRRARKTMHLWSTPQYLVVSLKRFSSEVPVKPDTGPACACCPKWCPCYPTGPVARTAKVNTPVSYPLSGLDLAPFVADQARDAAGADAYRYDLYAVALHRGSLHSGHVTALAQHRGDGRWRLFDDSAARVVDPARDVRGHPDAYMLLYRRCAAGGDAGSGGDVPQPGPLPKALPHHDEGA